MIDIITWKNDMLYLLDQRKLPNVEEYVICKDYQDVAEAIYNLTVRGAPLIGVTAAMGFALGAKRLKSDNYMEFFTGVTKIKHQLAETRPTAKNLFWALEKMMAVVTSNQDRAVSDIKELLISEAHKIKDDDYERNKKIGEWGESLFNDGDRVLTHCNAGALATSGPYGTATSPIRAAIRKGKKLSVISDETRPVLQGARLTSWECSKDSIPVTLICDNSAGFLMAQGMIDKIIVGADRIAGNGDVANKIGTYSVAVLAKYHNIPFYVAAPLSTFDFSLKSGSEIPIEERDGDEVRKIMGNYIAPKDITVKNIAFDITPFELITAIISEEGIAKPPFGMTFATWKSIE